MTASKTLRVSIASLTIGVALAGSIGARADQKTKAPVCDPWQFTDDGGFHGGEPEAFVKCDTGTDLYLICHGARVSFRYAPEDGPDDSERPRLEVSFNGSADPDDYVFHPRYEGALGDWVTYFSTLDHPFLADIKTKKQIRLRFGSAGPTTAYPLVGSSAALAPVLEACSADDASVVQRFEPVRVDVESVVSIPPEITSFAETLYRLMEDGAFEVGKGATADPGLGGMSPKEFLLSRVSTDFRCQRDFGGVCHPSGAIPHVYNFIGLAGNEGSDWFYDRTYDRIEDMPLDEIDLSQAFSHYFPLPLAEKYRGEEPSYREGPLLPLTLGHLSLSKGEDGELCFPGIPPDDVPLPALSFLGEDSELSGLAHFLGVGIKNSDTQDIHRNPSTNSPLVNSINAEVVFVPGQAVFRDGEEEWLFVVPAAGEAGFLNVSDTRLHILDQVVQNQLCFRTEDGVVKISAHVGGGD